jgi:hypothetical protein
LLLVHAVNKSHISYLRFFNGKCIFRHLHR